ncbi:M48 family peptidase [bacterium]|nr:MAG: M48 family peptidase [bacterium]
MYQERRQGCSPRLLIALGIAAFSACSYFRLSQTNPVTGEKQRIDVSPQQEIALGLQAVPEMVQQFGGEDPNDRAQAAVDEVGRNIVAKSEASKGPYQYEFTVLADGKTVNAFALPGGQIFITRALLSRLKTKDQLAGVLGHEIVHVVGRHGAEQLARQRFAQGLTGAAVVASVDPSDPRTYKNAAVAQAVSSLISLRYGREDELESDRLGVRYMKQAGYDPHAMIEVMKILEQAGGKGGPEFFQSHPNPENRIQKIEEAIRAEGG